MTKYPVYIVSKGRFEKCLTAKFFSEDKLNFKLVVEPQEYEEYAKRWGENRVLKLPFSNLGLGSMPARNWIWEHSKADGYKRHWIFDDNIRLIGRLYKGKRLRCNANDALTILEEFVDRYENIGIAGLNYQMFVPNDTPKPYYLNVHVYSALLILNELPFRWRMRYNEDTDLCLQVLSNNFCTVLFNAFFADKIKTMTMKGGNMETLYKDNGRLKMARALEEMWPELVKTKWRFKRPQHVVNWNKFTQQLIRRKDIDFNNLKKINEFGLKLSKVSNIKSESLRKLVESHQKEVKNS